MELLKRRDLCRHPNKRHGWAGVNMKALSISKCKKGEQRKRIDGH